MHITTTQKEFFSLKELCNFASGQPSNIRLPIWKGAETAIQYGKHKIIRVNTDDVTVITSINLDNTKYILTLN